MSRWQTGEGWVDRVCDECGAPFRVPRHRLKVTPCRYCSPACSGVSRRGPQTSFAPHDELARLYVDGGQTLRQIAQHFGVSGAAVAYQLERAGIERRIPINPGLHSDETRRRADAARPRGEVHPQFKTVPVEEVVIAYADGCSTAALGARFGVDPLTIVRRLRAAGVEVREGGFGRWRKAADGHAVQSAWELSVDDWLSAHGIEHEVHPILPFGRRQRADFLARGRYIEVWGVTHNATYAERRRVKIERYRTHGLVLIEVYPRDITHNHFAPLHVLL